MIVASILEVVSIGAIVPFLGALTSPERIYQHDLAQPLILIFEITEPNQLLLPLTFLFIIATLVAGTVRLILLYALIRLSNAVGSDLSINIYRRTLYQDYLVHTARNSSDVINSIIIKTNAVVSQIVLPTLSLTSSIIIMMGIMTVVFMINAKMALISFATFALIYWIISAFTKKYLHKNSQLIANQSTQMIKSLQEGLGGIRDVLIDGTQEIYCNIYKNADLSMRKAIGENNFIGQSPRYLIEALGMTLIAILAYVLALQEGAVLDAIPLLGAVALGAQKLLPSLQLAYRSYTQLKGSKASFNDVLDMLNQPLSDNTSQDLITPIPFEQEIVFKNLSFRYSKDTPWVLKNVNLTLKKGETIGFIGETGSGKSTLLDILMGLLPPTSGEMLVDGVVITETNRRGWQKHISHVPQSIYLADTSIKENIAFGVRLDHVKEHEVIQAAQQAQISKVIDNLKNKYKTFIGERGVQLSGGQRQRIGIARALYKGSNVIVFDEATSALDNQTEKKIMQQIAQLKSHQTIFIIAHRISTLEHCDGIIQLNADHSIERVNFEQIYNREGNDES